MNTIHFEALASRMRVRNNRISLLMAGVMASALFSMAAWAQPASSVQARYVGAEGGDWGGKPGAVVGPADNTCANMGAVGKVNHTSNYGFVIPGDAEIIGITAHVKTGSTKGQNVGIQLASNAADEPPTYLGDPRVLSVSDVGSGNCSDTQVESLGTTLEDWGINSLLSPAVVNAPEFGVVFSKLETSEVKVDALCLEIEYLDDGELVVTEECFSEPPLTNAITVVKQVVGALPQSDWAFSGDEPIGNFSFDPQGGFDTFEELEDGTYNISETPQSGYLVSTECFIDDVSVATGNESISVDIEEGEAATCVFTNTRRTGSSDAGRATFRVTKEFTDGNPSEVEVALSCNTGLILDQTKLISSSKPVEFVVTAFTPGKLNCDVFEVDPAGYTPAYTAGDGTDGEGTVSEDADGCYFDEVVGGGFTCHIVNTPAPVDVVITKEWVLEGSSWNGVSLQYEISMSCDAEIDNGYPCGNNFKSVENSQSNPPSTWCISVGGSDSDVFSLKVHPDQWPSNQCQVEETAYDGAVDSENGCGEFNIAPGDGHSCTITNTVFFEGIPTLDRYGLALLAALMLGVGLVTTRRFIA